MQIFDNQLALSACLETYISAKITIGFVPTMGALHDGHLSLLTTALKNNKLVVISIFVNPTQFNNPEDLEKYPRTLVSDIEKINTISENIILFTPTVTDIYKNHAESKHFDFDGLEFQMEGKFRPGHFNGVATIVEMLFDIVKPTNAYFGEKDYQQLKIIEKLAKKSGRKINVVAVPILRESNGLAMSSRNERLTHEERCNASIIYEVLNEVKKMFNDPKTPLKKINDWVFKQFTKKAGIKIEYFQISDESTLIPCQRKSKIKNHRAFIAVHINNVRLIDTISLK